MRSKIRNIYICVWGRMLMVCLMLASVCAPRCRAGIVINEIMQSNLWEYMDSLNEFPDSYVEIYNAGDTSITMYGWRIGEKMDYEKCYEIPVISLGPQEFWTLHCDKLGMWHHPDFRLNSGKGTVYLFDGNGELHTSLSYKKQPAPNIAYGRETDGGEKWGYMLKPTPKTSNVGGVTDNIAPEVSFSVDGGIWTEGTRDPFYVSLSVEGEEELRKGGEDIIDTVVRVDTLVAWDTIVRIDSLEIEGEMYVMYDSTFVSDTTYTADTIVNVYPYFAIRYTTDGKEPTEESAIYGGELYVDSSVAIKAKAFVRGYVGRPASVRSYIWHPRDVHMAAVSLVTDPDYFFGEKGLYTMNSVEGYDSKARRPINLEYFPKDGRSEQQSLNQICEGNVAGAATAVRNKLKSLTIRANKRFGKEYFTNQFFPELKPEIREVKSMKLCATNLTEDMTREPMALEAVASKYGMDYQAHDPVIVYLNAKPYGFLWLYERTNEDYVQANYGTEDVDIMKYVGDKNPEIVTGDDIEWNNFQDFQKETHSLEEWDKILDVEAYVRFMVLESFLINPDFMNNNLEYFRLKGEGNVWRPLLYDIELMFHCEYYEGGFFELLQSDSLFFGNDNLTIEEKERLKRLWRSLRKSEGFDELFVNRAVAMGGDCMREENFLRYFEAIREEINEEVRANGEMYDLENLKNGVNNETRYMLEQRCKYFASDVRKFFNLGSEVSVRINSSGDTCVSLQYDSFPLVNHSFDGIDYVGRTMRVGAEIKGMDTRDTVNWFRTIRYADSVSIDFVRGNEVVMVVPEGAMAIELEPTDEGMIENGITTIYGKTDFLRAEEVSVVDMLGRMVYRGSPMRIGRQRNGVYSVFSETGSGKIIIRNK